MLARDVTLKRKRQAVGNGYVPETARIINVRPMTAVDTLFDLQMESGRSLGHAPGQFVQVSVLGVGECPISICSPPTRPDTFQLSIRRVGEVTGFIHKLGVGDVLGIRGPLGHGFEVSELHGNNVLMIAGGCGLAPARSLIHNILDERERFGRFHLLYGARSPSDILFADEVGAWQDSQDVDCHVTVDNPDENWRGATGVVTRLFEKIPELDRQHTRVVVIGPPAMFKFVMLEVLSRRIPQSQIFCSLERRMKCGIGKCGHCQVNRVYACLDGPVFKYSELVKLREALA